MRKLAAPLHTRGQTLLASGYLHSYAVRMKAPVTAYREDATTLIFHEQKQLFHGCWAGPLNARGQTLEHNLATHILAGTAAGCVQRGSLRSDVGMMTSDRIMSNES